MNPDLNNGDENPYDFIFKQDKPNAAVSRPSVNVNKSRQMIIFGAFVVVILIVVSVAFSVISSSSKDKGTEAINARAYQAEIARVLEIGNKNAVSAELRKKTITVGLVIATDQSRVDSVISSKGLVPTPIQLTQQQSSARDKALSDSLQTDTHDQVFEEIIDKLVSDYYSAAKAAEAVAKTARERDTLTLVRKNVEILYSEATTETKEGPLEEQPSSEQSEQPTEPATEEEIIDRPILSQ